MSAFLTPRFDPELDEVLKQFPGLPPFNRENLQEVRKQLLSMNAAGPRLAADSGLNYKDITILGPAGDLTLAVFIHSASKGSSRPGNVLYAWRWRGIWR